MFVVPSLPNQGKGANTGNTVPWRTNHCAMAYMSVVAGQDSNQNRPHTVFARWTCNSLQGDDSEGFSDFSEQLCHAYTNCPKISGEMPSVAVLPEVEIEHCDS